MPLIVILIQRRQMNQIILMRRIAILNKRKDRKTVIDLAKKFIDKECIIYTFNAQIIGIVKEVTEKALLLEGKDSNEIINLDFIVRIREFPKNKKGKKKSVVLD
jgi:ABC-type antimicrobial peptide transport system ATPase subunit